MVENKEESLARARERGVQLGLDNVWFYQSNMDYYQVIGNSFPSKVKYRYYQREKEKEKEEKGKMKSKRIK
jgi:hypothetical protein